VENLDFIRKGQGRDMKAKKCPYCGQKVSYLTAIMEKDKGEHTCKKCGRNSTIYFIKALRAAIIAAVAVSAVILTVWLVLGDYTNLWGMLWVFLPFLVFYVCTPVFYRLVPLKTSSSAKQEKEKKAGGFYAPTPASGSTKILPNVSQVSGEILLIDDDIDGGSTRVIPAVKEGNAAGEDYLDISEFSSGIKK